MKNYNKIILYVITACILNIAHANVDRHIYNPSSYLWTIKYENNLPYQYVSIWNYQIPPHNCINQDKDDPVREGHSCTVRPQAPISGIDITYGAPGDSGGSGTITITDQCGVEYIFNYGGYVGASVYIQHTNMAYTGGISLNDPTPGDMTINGRCFSG